MKKPLLLYILLALSNISCYEQPLSYTVIVDKYTECIGSEWKKLHENQFYIDLQITDSFYVFINYDNDTILHVFNKNFPSLPASYGLSQGAEKRLTSIEFVERNTRYPLDRNDFLVVDNKNKIKQIRCERDSISIIKSSSLPVRLERSSNYNLTSNEIYGVLNNGDINHAFYFFNPDSGYYKVDMYGMSNKLYKKNPFAYIPNLSVNAQKNKIACAFRFFNKIQFFDLRGKIIRDISFGEEVIMPKNKADGTLDLIESVKCFIDIYTTNDYVYCIYDGSTGIGQQSKIVVFNWEGKHVKTLQSDRIIKKIAVDESNSYIIALVNGNTGERSIVKYHINI